VNIRIQRANVYDVNMSEPEVQAPQAASERAYHHGNLKASLIEAGLAALNEVEADALSLRQLAKVVGVSPNAAYRHFADKRDLLDALATEGFRQFASLQRASVKGLAEPTRRLQACGQAYVDFARSQPALYRLMFQQLASGPDASPALLTESVEGMAVLLETSSALLQATPDDERVRVMAAACWSLVHGLSSLAMTGQLDVFGMDVGELIQRVVAMSALLQSQAAVAEPRPGG
jgi:AcrR family transcriptional regulator